MLKNLNLKLIKSCNFITVIELIIKSVNEIIRFMIYCESLIPQIKIFFKLNRYFIHWIKYNSIIDKNKGQRW